MKRTIFLLIALIAFALSGPAMAQFTDILGPHNLNGHGCATCHAPHSGAVGNGGTNAATGETYLWGRDFAAATTYNTFGGKSITMQTSYLETDPLFHTAACLSCHDSGITGPSGGQLMTGVTLETTADGFTPPTFLNDGTESLKNDHPVHVAYNTASQFNWPGTVTAGVITWTVTNSHVENFARTYGHPTRFYADAANNQAMVECSTCHNPHSMNWARYNTVNTTGWNGTGTGSAATTMVKPSRFFVRGWYDGANLASNSATQFCRSCHYSKSNEYVNVDSVTN